MSERSVPDTQSHHPDRAACLAVDALLPCIPVSAKRVLDCTGVLAQRGVALKNRGIPEVFGLVDASAGTPRGDEGYDQLLLGSLDFLTLPYEAGSVDCILCTHVLERLRNPEAFLKRLLECLCPGGMLIMTIPNLQYHKTVFMLAEGRWCYGNSGIMARENLRFYTAHEMRWMLQRLGITNARFTSLVSDEEETLPRDGDGCVRRGGVCAGPLSDELYRAWLTEYYLMLASRG